MGRIVDLERDWLERHPLPELPQPLDKNSRGQVLLIGGSLDAPGGICLAAEAAFRAGAGKVRVAVPEVIAVGVGIAVPESGVIALSEQSSETEIAKIFSDPKSQPDCVAIGPAMSARSNTRRLLSVVLDAVQDGTAILLDALACENLDQGSLRDFSRLVLTPNAGELAQMLDREIDLVLADPGAALEAAVHDFESLIVLKGERTLIGAPGSETLVYAGGGPGLAVSGSGDVLAGTIGGLLARGADAQTAAAWGVWLHGESGRREAQRIGALGFLARDISRHVPALMPFID